MTRSIPAISSLEQRQLLSGTMEITISNGMGVHSAAINLPLDSLGFVGFVDYPATGSAFLNEDVSAQVIYESAGVVGVESFEFMYLDSLGNDQIYIVNVTTTAYPDSEAPSGSGGGTGTGSGAGTDSGSPEIGDQPVDGYGMGGASGNGSGTEYEFEYEYGYGIGGASGSESGVDNSSDAENEAAAAGSGTGTGTGTSTGSFLPPVAVIKGTKPVPNGGTLSLNGLDSYDQDQAGASIVAYKWDLDGDGAYDDSSSASLTIPWTTILAYGGVAGANYTVNLQVTDNEGQKDTETFVTPLGAGTLQPPVAVIRGTTSVPHGSALSLDGTASYDQDQSGASITAHKWDLDNDGQYDDSTSPIMSIHWDSIITNGGVAGTNYTVKLQVTDNEGVKDKDTETFVAMLQLPKVSVSAIDANASETGPDTGTYKFSRTGSTTKALSVSFAMTGNATNGTDYNQLMGTVEIPAGSDSKTVTLTPIDDNISNDRTETAIATITANEVDPVYWTTGRHCLDGRQGQFQRAVWKASQGVRLFSPWWGRSWV